MPISNGKNSAISAATAVVASGTAIDFLSIPSWAKRITIIFNGISLSGTSNPMIQIGSGSMAIAGYISSVESYANTLSSNTSGFMLSMSSVASWLWDGTAILNLIDSATNTWEITSSLLAAGAAGYVTTGNISLGGVLDRVRVTTVSGTDTFDAGKTNIFYE